MSICPRCKRPLEDEEAYICCAGVELRWRCTACHKVSEGFAFPYGMCPYCKGKLEMLDRGAIADDVIDDEFLVEPDADAAAHHRFFPADCTHLGHRGTLLVT